MNHDKWIQEEFRGLSRSLGFRYTSSEELKNRITKIRAGMETKEIESLLGIQKMNFYYLSGTTQDGLLYVPLEGKPLLMIKRELERAKSESPMKDIIGLKSNRQISSVIQTHCGKTPKSLGLEFDILPVNDYFKFQELFPHAKFMDASSILQETRKIKSPFEIDL